VSETNEEKDLAIIDKMVRDLQRTKEYFQLLQNLHPLVKSILSSSNKTKELEDFLKEASSRYKKSGERMQILKQDSKTGYKIQLDTLRKSFLYLALFETSVNNILDLLVMLLVLNGHDFFIQPMGKYRRYAKTIDDLDYSNVGEKLHFLNIHGFSMLTKNINKDLRNKIAHMDFDIEGNGIISVKGQKYNLRDEIIRLEAILLLSAQALSHFRLANLLP